MLRKKWVTGGNRSIIESIADKNSMEANESNGKKNELALLKKLAKKHGKKLV